MRMQHGQGAGALGAGIVAFWVFSPLTLVCESCSVRADFDNVWESHLLNLHRNHRVGAGHLIEHNF